MHQQAMISSLPKPTSGIKPIQGHTFIPISNSCPSSNCFNNSTHIDKLFDNFYICGGRTHSENRGTRNILSEITKFKLMNNGEIVCDETMGNMSLDAPRHNHTSLYFESIDSIVTFGGSNTEQYFNTIVMNIKESKKETISPGNNLEWPQTRHGHTANIYKQDQMIVFGGKKGFGVESDLFLNDLWSYNVKTNEWHEIKSLNNPPRERCWHSSVIYKDRYILMSGGFYTLNGDECYLNDLWSFDLETNMWTCLIKDDKSSSTKQRNRMGMVLSGNSLIIMFGNYFDGERDHFLNDIFSVNNLGSILNQKKVSNHCKKLCWNKLEVKAQDQESKTLLSQGRGHISSTLISENDETGAIQILLFGGESLKKRHDTFFILTIEV